MPHDARPDRVNYILQFSGSKTLILSAAWIEAGKSQVHIALRGVVSWTYAGKEPKHKVDKYVGHIFFPSATKLPAFRAGAQTPGDSTPHAPTLLSETKQGGQRLVHVSTTPYKNAAASITVL